ncbi:hypothetical protein RclHR1_09150003 [Rhizophagus clarus]|uniref:Uncharacterized protein n=1 Tax=Rhizophagus clarus TaxID=94130 RepID=A0A2Z6SHS0_9GLOM|nr:hypothetical protein RclHR1_09150003 [Rhizophagus clarus]GES86384.1 hypothetical protein GLOIN_2v1474342 [Rhizophagus clarus]
MIDDFCPINLDFIASDIKDEDLYETLSDRLGVEYLSEATREQELDKVIGILYGDYQRLFVTMTVELKGMMKNVHFLVNTGSPKTFICKDVLNKYNLTKIDPNEPIVVKLNDRQISVKVSPHDSRFHNINLLGTDYLHIYGAQIFVDFDEKYITMKFKTSPDPKKEGKSVVECLN